MKELYHSEKPLSPKDIRRKKDALKMAEILLLQHTNLSEVKYEVAYLNQCLEKISGLSWWKRPSKFVQSMAIGYALGTCLEQQLGFEWIVYQDHLGKNIALKHQKEGLICFPVAATAERINNKNYSFIPAYFTKIKTQIYMPNKALPTVHYVSQGNNPEQHIEGIKRALDAGCSWIQLRLKEVEKSTYIETGHLCRTICNQHHALLTINDCPDVALAVAADGLHLGKNDASLATARQIVGSEMIIGATVNNWQDILALKNNQPDYLGLGPLRFTNTKQKLSPVLGVEGYTRLLKKMQQQAIKLPVLAIGGIQLDDLTALKKTGVHGIAISGLLYNALDTSECFEQIVKNWV